MKKSLFQIIVFFIIFTAVLAVIQQNMNTSSETLPGEEKRQENITETKEVTLSKWLELYNNSHFSEIEIEDGTTMNGLIFIGTGKGSSLFGSTKITDDFVRVTSKKPLDTSISEL